MQVMGHAGRGKEVVHGQRPELEPLFHLTEAGCTSFGPGQTILTPWAGRGGVNGFSYAGLLQGRTGHRTGSRGPGSKSTHSGHNMQRSFDPPPTPTHTQPPKMGYLGTGGRAKGVKIEKFIG